MADTILTDGDDIYTGTVDDDVIYGRGGSDIIDGDSGSDRIYDGNGNPGQPEPDSNSDILRGGAGDDFLSGAGGSDRLEGGDGNDQIAGDWQNTPNPGNDTLLGGAGSDSLVGWAGNDILIGGTGADRMSGGTGNDRYYVDNIRDSVFEGKLGGDDSNGIDEVYASISFVLSADAFNGNFENLRLIGTTSINATGNALNNRLIGNSGNNILNGMAGADTMSGGEGNDTYGVDSAYDRVTEAAAGGTDVVHTAVSYTLAANVENLLQLGSSSLNGSGNALNNELTGNVGSNRLDGKAGNDTMSGRDGTDTLIGGDGNDTLTGGSGADKLYGGAGADTFVFQARSDSSLSVRDMIYDFSRVGGDKIDVSAIDARTTVSGNQAFTFIGAAEFSEKAGELRAFVKNGETFIHGDLNGDSSIDFSVRLATAVNLINSDFIL